MKTKRGAVRVLEPAYCSRIDGDTVIRIKTDGEIGGLRVHCAVPDEAGTDYRDEILSTLTPDADGEASFLFPASRCPHGPVNLRIQGGEGERRDECCLQLYNTAGTPFREGADSWPRPAFAEGMELRFLDDFTDPDLSISSFRSDARYYCHKPGGGDFSKIPFSDFEGPGNPFSQTDTYLRIRADRDTNTTGLISSVLADGSGFEAKAPCYFECRMLCPNAVGSWPAFWLLTNHAARGRHVPVDELDTIEAYGLEDLDHQNQVGYYVTSHRWNQGSRETTDPSYFIDMREIGNRLGWDACFHSYGTLITEEKTVYTCDGNAVYSHPTQPVSKEWPFYFMLNLAVGGNGWPVDLSRYGKIDLWADFIRVWAG